MKNKKIIISICLVVAWMIVIYIFSNMPGNESHNKSKQLIKHIIEEKSIVTSSEAKNEDENIIDQNNETKLDNNNNFNGKQSENNNYTNKNINKLDGIIRKVAHASEYFILTILVINLIFQIKRDKKYKYYIIGILICFIYACADEFHQLYVVERTGQFIDVLIDTVGIILAATLSFIIVKIKDKLN